MDTKIFDGEYEIIYNGIFNVYNSILKIEKVNGIDYTFEFNFKIDTVDVSSRSDISGNDTEKKVLVTLYNFNNPLGIVNTKIIQILADESTKKNTYFSVHSRGLSKESTFLQVVINFYTKDHE